MKHNMGNVERGIRMTAGILLCLFSLAIMHGFGVFYGVVNSVTVTGLALTGAGVALFATGVTGYCALNSILRLNSCKACRTGEAHTHNPV